MPLSKYIIISVLAVAVTAQTYSPCNPRKGCTRVNPGSKKSVIATNFAGQSSLPAEWMKHASDGDLEFGPDGVGLVLAKRKDSPQIDTNFRILFGSVEAKIKVASGVGMISSFVTLSDTLDELDWEFTGVNPSQAQSNYFGKGGDGTFDRGGLHPLSQAFDTWHTYKIDWRPDSTTWSIDGKPVRTLLASQATGGGYPQTPSNVSLSLWAGGDPDMPEGTRGWAGGNADYSVPHKMWINSVRIVNYSPADSYTYSDGSGNLQSVVINGGSLMSNKDIGDSGPAVPPSSSSAVRPSTSTVSQPATPIPTRIISSVTSVTTTKPTPSTTSESRESNSTVPTSPPPASTPSKSPPKANAADNSMRFSLTTALSGFLVTLFVFSAAS